MNNNVQANKRSGFFSIGFSLLFMLLGYYLAVEVTYEQLPVNPLLVKGTGIACLLFFAGISMVKISKRLKGNG